MGLYLGYTRVLLGLFWDNGTENGNYRDYMRLYRDSLRLVCGVVVLRGIGLEQSVHHLTLLHVLSPA